jgi:hypothetical protein
MSNQRRWEQIFGASVASEGSLLRQEADPYLRRIVRRALQAAGSTLPVTDYVRQVAARTAAEPEDFSQTVQRVCDAVWEDLTRPQVRQPTLLVSASGLDTVRAVRA